jgi:hypothetical protein
VNLPIMQSPPPTQLAPLRHKYVPQQPVPEHPQPVVVRASVNTTGRPLHILIFVFLISSGNANHTRPNGNTRCVNLPCPYPVISTREKLHTVLQLPGTFLHLSADTSKRRASALTFLTDRARAQYREVLT